MLISVNTGMVIGCICPDRTIIAGSPYGACDTTATCLRATVYGLLQNLEPGDRR